MKSNALKRNALVGDPWKGILHCLLESTTADECASPSASDSRALASREAANDRRRYQIEAQDDGTHSGRIVNVLDRLSERTVAVSWRDSTSCHYNDQIWRVGIAHQPGCCAITGMHIDPGDAIYRPIPAVPAPLNAHAMILASALAQVRAEI
ncbi:DUF3331 domain-containing protein [Pararobbsia silviterrae]|uniref:DUF3331 domain-containing protein n=1 Tax=Pararobbsia silviterrae TaxID=1792498 RepID=A0A494Y3X3_9BURK|nr:DUF3331 domain-containing protein [Pararobbsia silviterrae]RKP56718.1 DUF3331 domain-containing protein [Pararobbsia silviterrae]